MRLIPRPHQVPSPSSWRLRRCRVMIRTTRRPSPLVLWHRRWLKVWYETSSGWSTPVHAAGADSGSEGTRDTGHRLCRTAPVALYWWLWALVRGSRPAGGVSPLWRAAAACERLRRTFPGELVG